MLCWIRLSRLIVLDHVSLGQREVRKSDEAHEAEALCGGGLGAAFVQDDDDDDADDDDDDGQGEGEGDGHVDVDGVGDADGDCAGDGEGDGDSEGHGYQLLFMVVSVVW